MRYPRWFISASVLLAIALAGACARDTSAPADAPSLQAGRNSSGGGGKGGSNGGPSVKATDPAAAPQNITLDVRVMGSGFDEGSRVTFERGGTASAKVVTNSTSFVSSTELVANVTIAADADTAKYDVAVTTAKGIKGIGSVLFEVVGDPPATWLIPVNEAGLSVTGDGIFVREEYSAYESGVCGVSARIFATLTASNSGDAVVSTHTPRHADRKCAQYPRKIRFTYPDGTSELASFQSGLQYIHNTAYSIPIGATIKKTMNVGGGVRCGTLKFRPVDSEGVQIGGDSVLVTRLNSFTWEVQTRPYPDNKGYCTNTGELYHMRLRIRIESELALP